MGLRYEEKFTTYNIELPESGCFLGGNGPQKGPCKHHVNFTLKKLLKGRSKVALPIGSWKGLTRTWAPPIGLAESPLGLGGVGAVRYELTD